jgi:hypothetical protein
MDYAVTPNAVRWVGRCQACAQAVTVGRGDLGRFIRQGWPQCCGKDMLFSMVRTAPEPDSGSSEKKPAGDSHTWWAEVGPV